MKRKILSLFLCFIMLFMNCIEPVYASTDIPVIDTDVEFATWIGLGLANLRAFVSGDFEQMLKNDDAFYEWLSDNESPYGGGTVDVDGFGGAGRDFGITDNGDGTVSYTDKSADMFYYYLMW
ncbi:MAG: hypothetical protein Q4P17_10730, partial [Methanobacterium sp.]|nr:hypothetical protein [Methanobacterium sp.]